jgi:hypothetical protein
MLSAGDIALGLRRLKYTQANSIYRLRLVLYVHICIYALCCMLYSVFVFVGSNLYCMYVKHILS